MQPRLLLLPVSSHISLLVLIIIVIQPLQKIQNFHARLALLGPRHHHSTPLLNKLHLFPVSQRPEYMKINGSGPAYLSERLHVYTLRLVRSALLLTSAY